MSPTDQPGSGEHERISETDGPVEPTRSPNAEPAAATPPPSPAPPKGPRLRSILMLGFMAILLLWMGQQFGSSIGNGIGRVWDLAVGLFATDEGTRAETDREHGDSKNQFYTCGMHPWVILPKPGDCPICHMKLTPLDPAKFTGEITIDPIVVQNIGVRIERVTKGPLAQTIRTVGTVAYDETRVRDINIKVDGWIDRLFVDYVGAKVEKTVPLFTLYSRTLYSAQEEYLITWRNRHKKGVDFMPSIQADLERDLKAARTRLELFDIGEDQIRELERTGKQSKTMTIRSPHEGVVIEKHAFEGMHVTPGMRVYRIADLSQVWVMVTLYEYQVPYVKLGQKARMTLPYVPGKVFEGEVDYIYPWVEGKTRELKVRLEFGNADLQLRPDMFADVEIRSVLAEERVLVLRSAVIDTGERQVAFVSLGRGKFEPRMLKLGPETEGGNVAVLDGLRPGEMVVTSGQFLLDSESKIREALGKMIRGEMASEQEAVTAAPEASELQSLPAPAAQALLDLLKSYFSISQTLASDKIKGVEDASRQIAKGVDALLEVKLPDAPHFWHKHDEVATIRGKALEMVGQKDIAAARLAFADLSTALAKLVRGTGIPPTYSSRVVEYHCPMYREGQGGSTWLQPSGDVRNPFYGSQMLTCFDEMKAIPITGGAKKDLSKVPTVGARQEDVDALFAEYLGVQTSLADDSMNGVADRLKRMRTSLHGLATAGDENLARSARTVEATLSDREASLAATRTNFEAISAAMIEFARHFPPGDKIEGPLHVAYCSMKKASWLQMGKGIRNPFYGSEMLRCGTIQDTIPSKRDR